ncbi:MAG TPA: extensin family protein [Alphaproteobacteria bacterium]|nr:extensin family protein [Alphaproteobacteria bacterium]
MRLLISVSLLMTLAACGAPRAVVPPPPVERPPQTACMNALAGRGAAFDIAVVPVAQRGCVLAEGVSLRQAQMVIEPAATMSCPLALTLVEFDQRVIQPAARRHFGRPATTLRQIGAYSCRLRTGGSGRLSHHASGLAIDIAGFEIEDGPRVLVKEHWRDPGPRGRFLREVTRAACESFSVVLTPNHDVWHADHLHFDIGKDRLCGM